MRNAILILVGVIVGVVVSYAQPRVSQQEMGTQADEAAIIRNRDVGGEAWNRHDAKGVAATYSADSDRATNTGWWFGRGEVEESYADGFAGANKGATMKDTGQKVRFVTPDVAVLTANETITRPKETVRVLSTSVYVKRNGEWTRVVSRTIPLS